MPEIVKVSLHYVRRTQGLCRYEEEGDAPLVGTLYLSKARLGNVVPKQIVVTITAGDDHASD